MNKVIGVTELQRHFRGVLEDVINHRVAYILTRGSRPEAAMIPYEDYLRFQKLNETQVLARFDLLLEKMARVNVSFSDEEVAGDLDAAAPAVQRLA